MAAAIIMVGALGAGLTPLWCDSRRMGVPRTAHRVRNAEDGQPVSLDRRPTLRLDRAWASLQLDT